jgi:hypothetical protein
MSDTKVGADAQPATREDKMIEDGIGLIARGLFIKAKEAGHKEAAGTASSVINVVSGIHLDFLRIASKES